MLDSHYFTALVATFVEKETKKTMHVYSDKKGWRHFFEAAYSIGARSASSTDRHVMSISNKPTYKKTSLRSLEETVPELPTCNDVKDGSQSMRYSLKP